MRDGARGIRSFALNAFSEAFPEAATKDASHKNAPEPTRPSWDALILVCKACRKRRNSPQGVKPKLLASELRRAAKAQRMKTRVLLTSCQGLCPKAAITVACATRERAVQTFAIETLAQAESVAQTLKA